MRRYVTLSERCSLRKAACVGLAASIWLNTVRINFSFFFFFKDKVCHKSLTFLSPLKWALLM